MVAQQGVDAVEGDGLEDVEEGVERGRNAQAREAGVVVDEEVGIAEGGIAGVRGVRGQERAGLAADEGEDFECDEDLDVCAAGDGDGEERGNGDASGVVVGELGVEDAGEDGLADQSLIRLTSGFPKDGNPRGGAD